MNTLWGNGHMTGCGGSYTTLCIYKNIELYARECISKYRLGKPLKKAQQNKQTKIAKYA